MRKGSGRAAVIACWIAIGAQASTASQPGTDLVEDVEEDEWATDEVWAELLRVLDVLDTGTREEKLSLLTTDDHGFGPFWPIDIPPREEESATREVVERLRDYVLDERDTWVLDRVVASLADEMMVPTTPVFLDLLDHKAPSVRHRALQFINSGRSSLDDDQVRPLLEELWRTERTPWLRTSLIAALERAESQAHVSDCLDLIWQDDIDLARAAIRCVKSHPNDEAVASLVRRSKVGAPLLRVAALQALRWQSREHLGPFVSGLELMAAVRQAPWLEVPLLDVLDAAGSERVVSLARARLWDEDERMANTAIRILGHRFAPDHVPVLVQRAREGPEDLRAAAIRSLDQPVLAAEVADLLFDTLAPEQPRALRIAALQVFSGDGTSFERGPSRTETKASRKQYLGRLRAIAVTDPDEVVRAIAEQTVKTVEEDEVVSFSTHCGGVVSRRESLRVVAGTDAASVRCHDGPWIERAVERAQRPPAGALVFEDDRFDDGDSLWLSIWAGEEGACWLPATQLRLAQPDDAEDAPSSTSDFDMPLEATLTESFVALEEHGIVETFDRGSTLVGVRLTVDAADDEALAVLRGADEWADTPLGAAVRAFLPAVVERNGSRDGWDAWWR